MIRKYSFNELVSAIDKRLSLIEFERDKYSYVVAERGNAPSNLNSKLITVKYENRDIVQFSYYVSNTRRSDGRIGVSGRFTVRYKQRNDSEWYSKKIQSVFVTEFLLCSYLHKQHVPLEEAFDELLPLSDPVKKQKINDELKANGLDNFRIVYDTHQRQYVILGNIDKVLGLIEDESINDGLILYKYISFDTYFNMLVNQTYRMNSIISMNDESESLFLNDELFELYNGKGKDVERYKSILDNSNTLISSFTDQRDSGLMWRLYGESGKGICLGFKVDKEKIKKIHYINERSEGYIKLKRIVQSLKVEDIDIVFGDTDRFKFYMKSDGFKYEEEYRLSYSYDKDDLSWAKYGSLISPYHDFSFTENKCDVLGLSLTEVIIGAKIPNFEVNYPLLVKLTNEKFNVGVINISDQTKFRE